MENNYSRLKWVALIIIAGILFFLAKSAKAATAAPLFPQQEVYGVVQDQNGMPIPGVTIRVKNTTRGSVTNLDGEYIITAAANATLVFSYIGYKTLEVPVDNNEEISIQLEEDVAALGEVKINAGYYNTTERERTGSISRVTAEEIERQPVTNPLAALQGRMPGVNITQTTGVPGGGFNIQIRGINSIGAGNEPLYIVDGVPFSSESLGYNQTATVMPGVVSPLNNINPQDIESIEILKDADATAIYGSRGANGVVLITTKQGAAGKTRLQVNASKGFGEVSGKMDLMNTSQYLEMRREAFSNDNITEYPANAYDVNGTWDQNRFIDWQEELIGGQTKQHDINLRLEGGSENTSFLLGGSYHDETAVFPGDNKYRKASFISSFNHKSKNERLQLNFRANYVVDNNGLPAFDLTRYTKNLAPNAPELYNDDGSLNWAENTWTNPIAQYTFQRYSGKSNTLNTSGNITYNITGKLNIRANLGYNKSWLEEKRLLPSTMYNPAFNRGSNFSSVYTHTGERSSWIIEPQLNWEQSFDQFRIKFLGGFTFQSQEQERLTLYSQNFPSNELMGDITAASFLAAVDNGKIAYKYQAVFGRLNFNYKNRYILNLTARRDGSTRFGTENRFANFGAVGGAWIFTEENLFKGENSLLSFGKLRSSYGVTGNDQIGDYEYLDTYQITNRNYNNIIGLAPSRLYNPDFGWERNKKLEFGLELGFLGDRIFTSVSYYNNRSDNQLVGIPLPGTTGFSSIRSNLEAEIENVGWEFEVRSNQFSQGNFKWTTSFNLTVPKNRLVAFPGLEGSTYANSFVVGESINISKLYQLTGVNPETGVYDFIDFNNDGEITSPEDRQFIVNRDPKYFGGLSNHINFKDFDLNFLFQFVGKENSNIYSGRPGSLINQSVDLLDRWQQPGDNAQFQRFTTGGNQEAVRAFSRFSSSNATITDASFVRLKNVSLSYRLPFLGLQQYNTRVFFLGQNLWTFTNFKGADPEIGSFATLPSLRQLMFGIEFTF